jgi:hypothetical protein
LLHIIFNENYPLTLVQISVCWQLKLNRVKGMQHAHVKALIITNYYCLSSLAKPGKVRRALCSYAKIDLWLTKQFKSIQTDIDILGATSSTTDSSPTQGGGGG